MGQQVKSWCRQHDRLLIFISFLLLSGLSLYFVYFQENFLRASDFRFHQNRVEGLALAIKNNDWFPKINYFFLGGYGYASSLFYPDAYLYLPALLRVLGISFVASMAIFVFAVNLVTFSLTYYAGRLMALSKKRSYLFAILYGLSIYRMQDLFNRQALGEFLALSFFPLVLASLFLLRKGTTKCWPLLTLAMTGIGLAHFISIEMVSIWIGLYILFYWQQFFKKEVLLALAKAAGLTLLWLAFYLLPVAEQMKNQVFKVTSNPLTYISERSYPIVSLFINSLKSSVFHAKTANLGTLLFVGLVVAVVSLASKKIQNKRFIGLTLVLLLMVTTLFPWHWLNHTPLNTIQFPWRFLGILSVMLAFFIAQDEWGVFRKSWTVALLVFLAISNLGIYQYQSIQSQQGRLLTKAEYEQPAPFYIGAGHEYLPDEINYQELLKQKKRPLDYSAEQVTITNVRMPYGKISFDYQVVNQSAKVTVPFIYYLGYQATIQMKNQTGAKKMSLTNQGGLTALSLSGTGHVDIRYQRTKVQKIGTMITLLSVGGFGFSRFLQQKKKHKIKEQR
ncbi:hypothetical protein GUJ44_11270 [Enterococcus faecalis]|uniref:6-pyruvoyl-tetrahydropterin synthase-related protein n=1 Tax=Enterococcus TaxID=1350 RepID=UPI000352B9E2|nr:MULTISPECIES: 6-pyruvoyl-tetrahydropterin synthase-related protein [Enterococcus]EGO8432246.1 hypothetical protein [Enterococcus faecalis]EJV6880665.1 hypothetical protein [Enterococcus faecalis]EPI35701.1 hypothetical protein D348_01858 [Enterococcus faecalis SLO2C-1]MDU4527428.1 6-pyruvoyl-tetrahydropterin synthase-related protein [Enterococcus faecalis]NAA42943.1 hypothetical protein [Enterococcus faecalis]